MRVPRRRRVLPPRRGPGAQSSATPRRPRARRRAYGPFSHCNRAWTRSQYGRESTGLTAVDSAAAPADRPAVQHTRSADPSARLIRMPMMPITASIANAFDATERLLVLDQQVADPAGRQRKSTSSVMIRHSGAATRIPTTISGSNDGSTILRIRSHQESRSRGRPPVAAAAARRGQPPCSAAPARSTRRRPCRCRCGSWHGNRISARHDRRRRRRAQELEQRAERLASPRRSRVPSRAHAEDRRDDQPLDV